MKPVTRTIRPRDLPSYPIRVGFGAWSELLEWIPGGISKAALVSDQKVCGLYGEQVTSVLKGTLPCVVIDFPPGEESKTREQKARIEDQMLGQDLGRDTVVLALGGGVTSDLAGFVAATYHRGIPWISLPTTLLAMVDASIGGKTGVNASPGKNLIGSFHHPRGIVVDVHCLDTLPEEEMLNGMAEMAKAGIIADPELFEMIQEGPDLRRSKERTQALIVRAAGVKIRIIEKDPTEESLRQVLNFGHTLGHALEGASRYQISHGLSTAAGMHLETRVAERAGILNYEKGLLIRKGLEEMGLSCHIPKGINPFQVMEAMSRDKKKRAQELRFALPEDLGRMAPGPEGSYTVRIEKGLVEEVLREACI